MGLTLLAEEGLSGIKVDRLCARMGVTKGSFFHHFRSKEQILVGAVTPSVLYADVAADSG